ncbi:zf-HC2 domain-containing protein [Kitasatospora atroaurantiaca]|uniref:Putative zinc finger protein n=1 Tax=Kitasatospora atroaurantiaca TaxID=285545 RepID=A0A561ETW1_9ACTN|nr:zf-HC2 domain-containing protein [Kitasatospora atroaurantiaca]TWE19054.1 putative zinc finger protein [Kitasatospora atroaurantiaca]
MNIDEQRHEALRSLLGAWALDACPRREAAELTKHLVGCPECAEEAARLRDAAGRLSADEPLDPSGALRQQVLDWCLSRRAPELPVPPWAAPYATETAKLDALLRDLGPAEWQEVAELPWHGGVQRWRPAEVLCHLAAVDGYAALALGLPDPVPGASPEPVPARVPPQQAATRVPAQGRPAGVLERTDRLIAEQAGAGPAAVRALWRRQNHALVRTAVLSPHGTAPVDFGFAVLPLRDAFVDRAFECWIHGDDIARAVDYPYEAPATRHLRLMVDLAARMLPAALAALREKQSARAADGTAQRRLLRLVIDGPAAGEWLIPLDGPAEGPEAPAEPVASMVLDGLEFCYLAAAHRDPDRLPVGEYGDRSAIREVLRAAPLLSRP